MQGVRRSDVMEFDLAQSHDPSSRAKQHGNDLAMETIMPVLRTISNWVNKYRQMAKGSELDNCSPDDLRQIACDLGVPISDLQVLASTSSRSGEYLRQMLAALQIDPSALADSRPSTMRDLQRVCATCSNMDRCRDELVEGTAGRHFHEFCPNAYTLDAVCGQTESASRH